MAGEEPRNEEDTKGDVAGGAEAEVVEDFSALDFVSWGIFGDIRTTHAEENVNNVHHDENDVPDFGLVEAITGEYKGRGENVVCKHLPMILAFLFDVHDEKLLQPKSELH